MKIVLPHHFLLRMTAPLTVVLCAIASYSVSGPGCSLETMFCWFSAGNVIFALYPLPHEDMALSKWMVPPVSLSFVAVSLLSASGWLPLAAAILSIMVLLIYDYINKVRKYSGVRQLFRREAVRFAMEDEARNFYHCLLFSSWVLFFLGTGSEEVDTRLFFLWAGPVLFVLQWVRAYTGRTLFFTESRERRVRNLEAEQGIYLPAEIVGDEFKRNKIYRQALEYLENDRPWLDDSFNIDDLSRAIGVNRTFLSQVINAYSGKNFRQLVNYYRVMYATQLMRENPELRVLELAVRSGFHTTVSFNMSFKIVTGLTPGDYKEHLRKS